MNYSLKVFTITVNPLMYQKRTRYIYFFIRTELTFFALVAFILEFEMLSK